MAQVTQKQAQRRYMRAFIPLMIIYTLILVTGRVWWSSAAEPSIGVSIALAIAAALPMLFVFYVMIRYIKEADEFMRMQSLWSLTISGTIVCGAAFVLGMLQSFGVDLQFADFWYAIAFVSLMGVIQRIRGGQTQ